MFLITTADERFWKTDEPVLFLGEWCKLYSRKALWQNMQQEVLAYHWDDRKKLLADYKYLQGIYEQTLADLARLLNLVHGKDHPVQYWRIIIGPWLYYFIQVFYDRYSCVEQAAKTNKVSDTLIGQYKQDEWVPQNYSEFSGWVSGDAYNHFLYGWIIESMKPFSFHRKDIKSPGPGTDKKQKFGLKQFGKNLILVYEQCLPHRFNKYVIISSYLSLADQWRLQLSLGQWPSLFAPEVEMPAGQVNWSMRNRLSLSLEGSPFEILLSQIIPQQMPKAYLEGHASLKQEALARYPARLKVILTANDFYSNESFKVFSAEHSKHGTRLAGVQHGGTYGAALFNASEEHEMKITDVYYTWGWKTDKESNVKPLAAAKLNRFKKGIIPDAQGKVLLTLGAVPRYSYLLYSIFLSSTGMLAYFQDQVSFINGLNKTTRKDLLIRIFPQDFEWSQKDRVKEFFPDAVFDHKKSIIESMKGSRLYVATYNSTTYLESFTANFPTIMFWNPLHWELRDEAKSYFDRLRAVGILHDTPQAAAAKVNEIFADPNAWWSRKDVQEAKNKFCTHFAQMSEDWLGEWREELSALKNL